MKLAVFGASGRIGRLLTDHAVAAGHEVLAFSRTAGSIKQSSPAVSEIAGDIFSVAGLTPALTGCDAVLCVIGHDRQRGAVAYSRLADAVLAAMAAARVPRLIFVTSANAPNRVAIRFPGAIDVRSLVGRGFRWLLRNWINRDVYADMRRAEAALIASSVAWTIVRPFGLTEGPATGRVVLGVGDPPSRAWAVSCADVAAFMLSIVSDPLYTNAAVFVGGEFDPNVRFGEAVRTIRARRQRSPR